MNPRHILPPLALCIMLAGCDTSPTLGSDNRQAGTSSETHTALQALADNVRVKPASPSEQARTSFAARTLQSAAACNGAEINWIQNGNWQQEWLPPVDSGSFRAEGNRWISRRVGLATDPSGRFKTCGEKGAFQLKWHEEILDGAGTRILGDGIASGIDQIKGIDRLAYSLASISPSGFRITSHEVVVTSEPTEGWFNWNHFRTEESYREFGNGRFRIPGMLERLDTNSLPGFVCLPIQNLEGQAESIGSYCSGLLHDSVFILDASGERILPTLLPSQHVTDSMGLSALSTHRDADSLHIRLRIQTPSAPGFSEPITRLCLGCDEQSRGGMPRYLDIPNHQAEAGTHIDWAIPLSTWSLSNKTLSILRRYPDWLAQMSNSPDSLHGWSMVSSSNLTDQVTP